jgi:hypothetical protein
MLTSDGGESAAMMGHVLWAVGGAVSFWVPIILVFGVQRGDTNTLIANLASVLGFSVYWAIRRRVYPQGRESIWMLVGLYCLGPIFLSTATTFVNGGFAQIHGWPDIRWLLLACVFPPLQFLLAATSGLWPSLLVVTVFLLYTIATERKQAAT